MASCVGHGLFTRFPTLRVMPIENGTDWVRPLLEAWRRSTPSNPHLYEEDPIEVFKRNVWVHPFHEEDPIGLAELVGADRVLFGSDYPHPEGLADPVSYVEAARRACPTTTSPRSWAATSPTSSRSPADRTTGPTGPLTTEVDATRRVVRRCHPTPPLRRRRRRCRPQSRGTREP